MSITCEINKKHKSSKERIYITVDDLEDLRGNLSDMVIPIIKCYMINCNIDPPIVVKMEKRGRLRSTKVNTLSKLLEYGTQSDRDKLNAVIYSQIEKLKKSLF